MGKVQLVVDMDEETLDYIKETGSIYHTDVKKLIKSIKNAVILPENHGRLGDLDKLETDMRNGIKAGNMEEGYEDYQNINNVDDCVMEVRTADTLVQAHR